MDKMTILIVDDDDGHALLIQRNLKSSGINNPIRRLADGQAALDFFSNKGSAEFRAGYPYLLLLDIRMPKVDGVEVLRYLKSDPTLRTIPVIMLTTTDDPREIQRCHELGCNNYVVKPVSFDGFVESLRRLGLFLNVVQVPPIIPPDL